MKPVMHEQLPSASLAELIGQAQLPEASRIWKGGQGAGMALQAEVALSKLKPVLHEQLPSASRAEFTGHAGSVALQLDVATSQVVPGLHQQLPSASL
jgi:hypothetical protein